uniref:Homeobox domain-containing protein n=1 Tax=Caenorhabditis tropicalis TaxID=1561998 RepID=A0A1I7V1Q8_9PELO
MQELNSHGNQVREESPRDYYLRKNKATEAFVSSSVYPRSGYTTSKADAVISEIIISQEESPSPEKSGDSSCQPPAPSVNNHTPHFVDPNSTTSPTVIKKKRAYSQITEEQKSILMKSFYQSSSLSDEKAEWLSKRTGLKKKTVKYWYQNQKISLKKKQAAGSSEDKENIMN